MTTVVYTDGACSGNPGPGGWAWAVDDGPYASGADAHTTNQRMEITAAFEAVRALPGALEVVSDSTYVVNCFRDRWWEGWLARDWRNSQRKPVANRDLWEPFVALVRERSDVSFRWVKGHAGDPMNDLVDRLAVEAATTQTGRSGTGQPEGLGPADRIGRARQAGPGAEGAMAEPGIDGHPLVAFGHRAADLGGYDDNPTADAVRARLADIIRAKAELEPALVLASGLGLGAETLAAEAALDVGVPVAAVLGFPEPQSVWPAASRARFDRLLARAAQVVVLQKRQPSSKQQAAAALARRDAWLTRHAAEALVVWDGADAALGRLFRSLEDRLGADVWVVDPTELV